MVDAVEYKLTPRPAPNTSLIASSHFPLTHAHVAFAIAQHRVAMADSRLEEQLEALENLPFSISRLLTEMRSIDARADALQKEIAALERSVLRNGKARSGSRYVAGMASRTPCPAASPPPSSRVCAAQGSCWRRVRGALRFAACNRGETRGPPGSPGREGRDHAAGQSSDERACSGA